MHLRLSFYENEIKYTTQIISAERFYTIAVPEDVNLIKVEDLEFKD